MSDIAEVRRLALVALRLTEPKRRAIRHFDLTASSGTVRRATCVFCGAQIDTESAKWRRTAHFVASIRTHTCDALYRYAAIGQRITEWADTRAALLAESGQLPEVCA